MKFIIVMLCGLAASFSVHAQLAATVSSQSRHEAILSPVFLQEPAGGMQFPVRGNLPGQHGIRKGKTLTIIGGILLVGGVVLVSSADALYYNSTTTNGTTTESGDIKGGLGVIMIAGGVGMIIPGIIIWSKNKRRYEQYKMEHPQQSLSLGVGGSGAGVAYRF